MKFSRTLNILLAAGPALASASSDGLFRRDTGSCNIHLATSNGGRKVAIVLDSSGSMSITDPDNLRIQAGKALNNQLVPASAAGGGKQADLVTVVDFDDTARVIYPLGDPAGADSSFDEIDSSGGTYIADGIQKAVAELTKPGNDPTADRSGIVVLTDGEDSDVAGLIVEVEAAGKAGIRVSFGFLAPPDAFFEPDLLAAILRTGGSYASFETADAIQSFLFLILSNGLTARDHGAGAEQPLLPGITVARLTGGASVAFGYEAQAGEALVFTVESLSGPQLDAELEDAAGKSVGKNSTSGAAGEPAAITYTAKAAGALKLVVGAAEGSAAGGEGVFQVSLNSSLGISGCNLTTTPPPDNSTGTDNTTVTGSPPTAPPTSPPTPTATLVVTAAAARLGTAGFVAAGMALAAALI